MNKIFLVFSLVSAFSFSGLAQEQVNYRACGNTFQCILVKTGWCETVKSINKVYLEDWKQQDKILTEKARESRRTCKPSLPGFSDLKNYETQCTSEGCTPQYHSPQQ